MNEKTNFFLCADCVGEQFLKAAILGHNAEEVCRYCENKGKTISIGELSSRVKTMLENYFQLVPGGVFSKGDLIENVIADKAKIDEKIATDVREVLRRNHPGIVAKEHPFDAEAYYIEKEIDDIELRQKWDQAQNRLKTVKRYFNRDVEKILEDIFIILTDCFKYDGSAAVVKHIDKTSDFPIYRARVFRSEIALKNALERPDAELGPPPANLAVAGRMNASGISVFYGACKIDLAIVEVRPPLNSRVVVGRFSPLRELRLLDVKALPEIYFKGSVFDPEHIEKVKRAVFLERLSKRISMPIMPDDAPLEYVVTQVIADYLADRCRFNLDGILYPPQKTGITGSNVMLFHSASRVKPINVPENAVIRVAIDEDASQPEYRVFEEVPNESAKDPAARGKIETGNAQDLQLTAPPPHDQDAREMTLELDITDVRVYQIEWPKYKKKWYQVKRIRQNQDPKKTGQCGMSLFRADPEGIELKIVKILVVSRFIAGNFVWDQ